MRKNMLNIVKIRIVPFIVSSILAVASIVLLAMYGLKPGIDFTGGSLLEVEFTGERPTKEQVLEAITVENLDNIQIQPVDESGYILKMRFITEDEHQEVIGDLREAFDKEILPVLTVDEDGVATIAPPDGSETDQETNKVIERRLDVIGPAISSHLRQRAIYAGIAVAIAIVLFVGYAFRKVSKPVQSWKYGLTAIVALSHDVLITMAVFAVLGKTLGVEVDIPFVVALLTILGYSVNDTIVVFDRIRENLQRVGPAKFEKAVIDGVNGTIPRSVNTSVTTLTVLFALFLFGGASVHYFSLALIIGIALGTYSSIFLASPLLVVWKRLGER